MAHTITRGEKRYVVMQRFLKFWPEVRHWSLGNILFFVPLQGLFREAVVRITKAPKPEAKTFCE